MIHHVSLGTNDVARSTKFYDAVLGVLGLGLLKASQDSANYGVSTVRRRPSTASPLPDRSGPWRLT
jgi:catechol 2,3-dioxygenase-like lactoylglutathione lyase family enzyme